MSLGSGVGAGLLALSIFMCVAATIRLDRAFEAAKQRDCAGRAAECTAVDGAAGGCLTWHNASFQCEHPAPCPFRAGTRHRCFVPGVARGAHCPDWHCASSLGVEVLRVAVFFLDVLILGSCVAGFLLLVVVTIYDCSRDVFSSAAPRGMYPSRSLL